MENTVENMTEILRGADMLAEVRKALSTCAMIVTDNNVKALYPDLCAGAYVIAAGEKNKTPETLLAVLKAMRDKSLTRCDRVAALGGGVVGDITGLAAALYMRGIKWISIPTSLLALVDAGIGGKTGVDFCGEKNLIGAFHAPETAILSYNFTDTLPEREVRCGIGEIVKTCLLTKASCEELFSQADMLHARSRDTLYSFIDTCVDIKIAVVSADPEENGLRRILNVGHTVGHALESADGFVLPHGEYVLKGIAAECAMFPELVEKSFFERLMRVVRMFVSPPKTSSGSVLRFALRDKKNAARRSITIMLPVSPGVVTAVEVCSDEFKSRYEHALRTLKSV